MKIKIERPCKTPEGRELSPGEVVDEDYRLARYLISQGYASKVPKTKPKPPPEKPAKGSPSVPEGVRDISDVMGEKKRKLFEGERARIESLFGKIITIEKFAVMKSKFGKGGPYAMIQLRDEAGKRFYTTSSSEPVLDALKQVEGTLPVCCKIGRRKSEKTGKWYWVLESAKS